MARNKIFIKFWRGTKNISFLPIFFIITFSENTFFISIGHLHCRAECAPARKEVRQETGLARRDGHGALHPVLLTLLNLSGVALRPTTRDDARKFLRRYLEDGDGDGAAPTKKGPEIPWWRCAGSNLRGSGALPPPCLRGDTRITIALCIPASVAQGLPPRLRLWRRIGVPRNLSRLLRDRVVGTHTARSWTLAGPSRTVPGT